MKKPDKPITLHFDTRAGSYWCPVETGEYLPLDTGQAKLHLRASGLNPDLWTDNGLNEVERALFMAQRERFVHYAGPLAGWQPGAFETSDGRKVLVTSGPRIPPAKPGKCQVLERFIGELLGGDQGPHFCYWLSCARRALLGKTFAPGQMVVFAGPSGCGKSLLQSIITAALGGRCASPWLYMTGETAFNADLAQAEHWAIEDRASSTDIRTRRKFGASVKEATVNRELQVHAKGRQAIVLPTSRRLSLSCNDEVENVMQVPPLDESLADKVCLYHCQPATVGPDRAETWKAILAALPGFLSECERMKIPRAWQCPRYGVKAYHNPTLLDILTASAPETRLLSIADEVLWGGGEGKGGDGAPWIGSAQQLERELLASSFGHSVSKLLYYSTAASVYLARLEKPGSRVSRTVKQGKTIWTILTP